MDNDQWSNGELVPSSNKPIILNLGETLLFVIKA